METEKQLLAIGLALRDLEQSLTKMRLKGLLERARRMGLKEEFLAPAIQATRGVEGPATFARAQEALDTLEARIDRIAGLPPSTF